MRIGTVALALIFFASGAKFLQDSGVLTKAAKGSEEPGAERKPPNRRKLAFGLLMLLMGLLITIYYIVT